MSARQLKSPEDAILKALTDLDWASAGTLSAITGYSETAIRNNLKMMHRRGWVRKSGFAPVANGLTEQGRSIAGLRWILRSGSA